MTIFYRYSTLLPHIANIVRTMFTANIGECMLGTNVCRLTVRFTSELYLMIVWCAV